jgi:hypothetical protein
VAGKYYKIWQYDCKGMLQAGFNPKEIWPNAIQPIRGFTLAKENIIYSLNEKGNIDFYLSNGKKSNLIKLDSSIAYKYINHKQIDTGTVRFYCLDSTNKLIVQDLISLLGATSLVLSASDHDAAVAKISHLPQIVSSLLAKQLIGTKPEWMELSGQGLRDSTRIAASDERLWKEIIFSNRKVLAKLLKDLQVDLEGLINNLEDPSHIEKILSQGRMGRELIPGKHGGKAREYSYLPIVIDDKPGQLAAIFNECSTLGVNVEDLIIEHSPGQLSALIILALSAPDAHKLSDHLGAIGWNVHPIRN